MKSSSLIYPPDLPAAVEPLDCLVESSRPHGSRNSGSGHDRTAFRMNSFTVDILGEGPRKACRGSTRDPAIEVEIGLRERDVRQLPCPCRFI